jgi:hypothetical protein
VCLLWADQHHHCQQCQKWVPMDLLAVISVISVTHPCLQVGSRAAAWSH